MQIQQIATEIVATLQKAGHIAYFAGGWVRDFLLKAPSDDIDIATSASVEEITSLFPKTIPVGVAFGIIVVVEKNHSFEVATFRKEKEYVDGRRPTHIEKASPEEDAQRRDFTINGLFFDPIKETLFDFVEGKEDLEKGVVRAIGDPHQRFLEDRLRMMRAVRYSTRFRFPIDCDTKQAILSHAKSLFPSVAIERVWQEFQKMSRFSHFDQSLLSLYELELLPIIFPSLKNTPFTEIEKRVALMNNLPAGSPLIAELLFLFPNTSLEEQLSLCDYLKLSRSDKELVQFLHSSQSLLSMPLSWQESLDHVEWAYFYANPSSPLSLKISQIQKTKEESFAFLKLHEEKQTLLVKQIDRIRHKTPLIKAADLQKEGILPGVQMGKFLKEAERISVNELLEEKEDVLKKIREKI